jgi:hypothetical protein
MAQSDSRRLNIVVPHLYPDLKIGTEAGCDYHLQNNSDGKGTFIVWKTEAVAEPTEQQLIDGKEAALDAWWWTRMRGIRDQNLTQSDTYAVTDRPNNSAWITYRQELRDLPTTITKPDYATKLNNQSITEWDANIRLLIQNPDGHCW